MEIISNNKTAANTAEVEFKNSVDEFEAAVFNRAFDALYGFPVYRVGQTEYINTRHTVADVGFDTNFVSVDTAQAEASYFGQHFISPIF